MLGGSVGPGMQASDGLLEVISQAADRSSGSDDLAKGITDARSRTHLSRLRGNLLLPLRVPEGARVLDVGCQTGALTRVLAEQGARVTGLEADSGLAAAAAARTQGLSNCEIVRGTLAEYIEEGHSAEFDLVLVSGFAAPSDQEAVELLAALRLLLVDRGVACIATSNQVGLKYLLGYPEDGRGLPWVGIDGYRSRHDGARTWSRTALQSILQRSGFVEQEWLYPFPDHVLPTTIAHHAIYGSSAGKTALRQFVRSPVKPLGGDTMLTADGISAFQTMLDAGMGPDTANSFLVLAGAEGSRPGHWLQPGRLWLSSGERARELMDRRALVELDGAWVLHPLNTRQEVHLPPLVSRRVDLPVVLGTNLEDEILGVASGANSPSALQGLLREWWTEAEPWLAPGHYHFDVMPRNFIRDQEGRLHYIDQEWTWTQDAPAAWALLRSLWFLILERLWPAGALAGLSWRLTLQECVVELARQIGPVGVGDIDSAIESESLLQARVSGHDPQRERNNLQALLDSPLMNLSPRPVMAQLVQRPVELEEVIQRERREFAAVELQLRDEVIGKEAELQSARDLIDELMLKVEWLRKRSPALVLKSYGARAKRQLRS